MASVVQAAAYYTLGLSISCCAGQFYGNPSQQIHIRLTIRFPSSEFSNGLAGYLQRVKDGGNRHIFTTGTVTSPRAREVSIVLPASVINVDANTQGIILTFDTPQHANYWSRCTQIWSQVQPKPGGQANQLRIQYNWTHNGLTQAVGLPTMPLPAAQGGPQLPLTSY